MIVKKNIEVKFTAPASSEEAHKRLNALQDALSIINIQLSNEDNKDKTKWLMKAKWAQFFKEAEVRRLKLWINERDTYSQHLLQSACALLVKLIEDDVEFSLEEHTLIKELKRFVRYREPRLKLGQYKH